MGRKYKITYNKDECIGAVACTVVAPEIFVWRNDEQKADLKGGKEIRPGIFELIVDESLLEAAKAGDDVCPVDIIDIEEVKD